MQPVRGARRAIANRKAAIALAFCIIANGATSRALAQDVSGRPDDLKIAGDRISIGIGIASTPTYIGSDNSAPVLTAAVQGQVSGISFNTQGTAIYADLVKSNGKPGWKLELGPLAVVRLDRTGRIGDTAVRALGKLDAAVELGGSIGVQRTGVITSPYDTLSMSLSYQHDVAHAHSSYVVSPEIDYDTPLSAHAFVSLAIAADYVGKGFGSYYYSVDGAGSLRSGLPVYSDAARPGWKDWNLSAMALHTIAGNLTHGWGIYLMGGYQRMLGVYKRSPIITIAGSPDQWSGAVGIEYTF